MTSKLCKICVEEKEISCYGLDKGKPRAMCKTCFNKKKKQNYVLKNADAIVLLKKTIKKQEEDLFLQKELVKKCKKVIEENDLEMPGITSSDEAYMYQFLYC